MPDVLTPEQRSRCMAAIKSGNTKPEMVVRRLVHALGYRYRLHGKDLPGKPDLVFRSRKKAIFIHGCFWHSHECKFGIVTPKTRPEWWAEKRGGTVARDRRQISELKAAGWDVLVIWECETKKLETLEKKLKSFLSAQH